MSRSPPEAAGPRFEAGVTGVAEVSGSDARGSVLLALPAIIMITVAPASSRGLASSSAVARQP